VKVVIDTNVFVSGIFFGGRPLEILNAWRHGLIEVVVSSAILLEYRRVVDELSATYPKADTDAWLELAHTQAPMVNAAPLGEQVCTDADDDKFLACAVTSGAKIVTSGDKALLAVSGFRGIEVLTPRQFVDAYLKRDKPKQ
jgi:putative PIN family toxin of toxin-antitoxin system